MNLQDLKQAKDTLVFLDQSQLKTIFLTYLNAYQRLTHDQNPIPDKPHFTYAKDGTPILFDFETAIYASNINAVNDQLTKIIYDRFLDSIAYCLYCHAEKLPQNYTIALALNIANNHWLGLVIRLEGLKVTEQSLKDIKSHYREHCLRNNCDLELHHIRNAAKSILTKTASESFTFFQKTTITYYDSLGDSENKYRNMIQNKLQSYQSCVIKGECAKQTDCTCGDHTILNLFSITLLQHVPILNTKDTPSSSNLRYLTEQIAANNASEANKASMELASTILTLANPGWKPLARASLALTKDKLIPYMQTRKFSKEILEKYLHLYTAAYKKINNQRQMEEIPNASNDPIPIIVSETRIIRFDTNCRFFEWGDKKDLVKTLSENIKDLLAYCIVNNKLAQQKDFTIGIALPFKEAHWANVIIHLDGFNLKSDSIASINQAYQNRLTSSTSFAEYAWFQIANAKDALNEKLTDISLSLFTSIQILYSDPLADTFFFDLFKSLLNPSLNIRLCEKKTLRIGDNPATLALDLFSTALSVDVNNISKDFKASINEFDKLVTTEIDFSVNQDNIINPAIAIVQDILNYKLLEIPSVPASTTQEFTSKAITDTPGDKVELYARQSTEFIEPLNVIIATEKNKNSHSKIPRLRYGVMGSASGALLFGAIATLVMGLALTPISFGISLFLALAIILSAALAGALLGALIGIAIPKETFTNDILAKIESREIQTDYQGYHHHPTSMSNYLLDKKQEPPKPSQTQKHPPPTQSL